MELYKRFRPKRLKDLVGQPAAVAAIQGLLTKGWPQAALFSGPSGCGKTTAARILKKKLGVVSDLDYREVNIAELRGINEVRKILEGAPMAALGGSKCRLWVFDEVHQMTKDGQNCMLKVLEDTPEHAYFILCTTDPHRLIKAIRTRCTPIRFGAVDPKELKGLVQTVCEKEEVEVSETVVDEIVSAADGSPREALVLLNLVAPMKDEEQQLAAVRTSAKTVPFNLVSALVFPKGDKKKVWKDTVVPMLQKLDDDPEGVRQLILKVCETMIFRGYGRAAFVTMCFLEPVHYTGRAGLTFAAYRALMEE